MFCLVSKERVKKAFLLLRDRLSWSAVGRFARSANYQRSDLVPEFQDVGSGNASLQTSDVMGNSVSESESTEALVKQSQEEYTVDIAADILDQALFAYSQDIKSPLISADAGHETNKQPNPEHLRRITTSVQHHCHVISNAAFYSNGVDRVDIFNESGIASELYSYPFGKAPNEGKVAKHRVLSHESDRHISGRTLCLHGDIASASGNYAHWLIDGLPRLFMAESFQVGNVDHYLVPPLLHDFVRDSLAVFGVDASSIVSVESLELVSFDELVCVSPPRGLHSNVVPPWAIQRYQSVVTQTTLTDETAKNEQQPVHCESNRLSSQVVPGERIYVSRRDAASRTFTNEHEVAQLLKRYGYRSVVLSEMDFAAKAQLFANAGPIVSLTGAGLTNVVFCSASSRMLELMPSSHVTYLYSSIATQIGMDYRHHIFEHQSILSRINPFFGNFRMDISELEKALVVAGMAD